MERTKRTYRLSVRTVKAIRELVSDYGVAPTQDALVEMALDDFARRMREEREARVWEAAADDPEFQRETREVATEFRAADAETWPA